jgi:deoxyribodipyrimidine photo-lyase
MQGRYITILDTVNDPKDALYIMHKSFRLNNNYALEALMAFASSNRHIRLYKRKEENRAATRFFDSLSNDLKTELVRIVDDTRWVNSPRGLILIVGSVDQVYMDMAYLKEDKAFVEYVKEICIEKSTNLILVENNVFVPVLLASQKEEYAARTIRPKINRKIPDFAKMVNTDYQGSLGEKEAMDVLLDFVKRKLSHYDQRNDPSTDYQSGLSPYLKYGFISPQQIYHIVKEQDNPLDEIFLEELIVRRELAYNFIYYNDQYDDFHHMTYQWAYKTMNDHILDKRETLYTIDDYTSFKTHDPYFNAAMKEMVYFGTMKSYMRMYWAKKIIEWSKTYEEAYQTALTLNNRYFIDGNTPNGYNGVAWCFGKHDLVSNNIGK